MRARRLRQIKRKAESKTRVSMRAECLELLHENEKLRSALEEIAKDTRTLLDHTPVSIRQQTWEFVFRVLEVKALYFLKK